MQLTTIEPAELEHFVEHHPYGNFVQSAPNAKRIAHLGWRPHYLGLHTNDGRLVATAVLYEWRTLGHSEFECLQGPVVDYHNEKILKELLTELKKYVKANRGLSLRLQPPLVLRHQSSTPASRPIPTDLSFTDNQPNKQALATLIQCGFKPVDTNRTDPNARYVRWFFSKDISAIHDQTALRASFDGKTRSCIKGATKYGVSVREITSPHDLTSFAQLLIKTGLRRGFSGRDERFYRQLFQAFSRQQAWFLIAELDLVGYETRLNSQLQQLNIQRATLANDPDKAGQVKELDNQRSAISRRLSRHQQLRTETTSNTLPLAAAIFVYFDDEVVYFLSGSDDRYSAFYGPYALQYEAMSRAISLGASRYNFYGTSGDFNGFPEQEGVYQFKKGFGGQLEEYAGCYDYTARPVRRALLRLLRALRDRLHH